MDFITKKITKGLNNVSNATEITILKGNRSNLRQKRNEITNTLDKYSDQIEFKAIIENNIKVNDETLKKLQENFIKGNVVFQKGESLDDFKEKMQFHKNKDELVQLYNLYLSLNTSNENLKITNEEINKVISIDRKVYEQKINEIDKQIEEVNNKLEKVRNKYNEKTNDCNVTVK